MKIYGREIRFRRTVGATCDIADLCPDKDISRIGEVMNGGTTRSQFRFIYNFIMALNKGYEDAEQFKNKDHVKQVITFEELSTLDTDEAMALFKEAMEVFNGDGKTTVETEKKMEQDAVESA